MTHSSQISGVERGAARVRHNRPSEGVLEFPLPRDVPEVWFQIFLPKKSDNILKLLPTRVTMYISPLLIHFY